MKVASAHVCVAVLVLFCCRAPLCAEALAARILDGQNTSSSTYPTVGRVLVSTPQGEYLGSCTLIAPQYVLTAAHMVTDDNGQLDVNHGTVTLNGAAYAIDTSNITVHPSWPGVNGYFFQEGVHDCSIVKLKTAPNGIVPSPLYRQAPQAGDTAIIVGYGLLGTGSTGETNDTFPKPGTVQFGTIDLDSVTKTYLEWTFHQGESNTGNGDSGGPTFFDHGGTLYVGGVTSGGVGGTAWGSNSYNMRVNVVASWIDSVLPVSQPPVIDSGPSVTTAGTITTNESVAFMLAATDPSGLPLTYAWDFGDGTTGSGTPVQHIYAAAGTYTVNVSVADNTTNTTASLLVTVVSGFLGNAAGASVPATVDKKSFTLNFAKHSDALTITLQSTDFAFPDKTAFTTLTKNISLAVQVAGNSIDTVQLTAGKGKGAYGTAVWNAPKGILTYTGKALSLETALATLGATNATTRDTAVAVPIVFVLGGVNYTATANFTYSAILGRTGKGQ